jgi:hypothetical protein
MQTQGENVMSSTREIKLLATLIVEACATHARNRSYLLKDQCIRTAVVYEKSAVTIDVLVNAFKKIEGLNWDDRNSGTETGKELSELKP